MAASGMPVPEMGGNFWPAMCRWTEEVRKLILARSTFLQADGEWTELVLQGCDLIERAPTQQRATETMVDVRKLLIIKLRQLGS